MKAIGYKKNGPIQSPQALIAFEASLPKLKPHDLLVKVHGISVNPVDTKVRKTIAPESEGKYKIIGYDAAGIVRATGEKVGFFKPGDEVFYAGDITRPGTNAEYHAVDERIVGRKPKSLGFAEAAGVPLTAITAWELLFDCLSLNEGAGAGETLLIIGAAGGVGSMLIQLAKKLTQLQVIATASRPETVAWVKKMGADQVMNHHQSMVDQLRSINITPRYVASLNGTADHFPDIVALVKPRGHIALIDDPGILDIMPCKRKALSISWEYMFARPMYQTDDIIKQQQLLNRVSALLDTGILTSTVTTNLGPISAETLIEAHHRQESGTVIGKQVLDGF